jgi:hypothetical protein
MAEVRATEYKALGQTRRKTGLIDSRTMPQRIASKQASLSHRIKLDACCIQKRCDVEHRGIRGHFAINVELGIASRTCPSILLRNTREASPARISILEHALLEHMCPHPFQLIAFRSTWSTSLRMESEISILREPCEWKTCSTRNKVRNMQPLMLSGFLSACGYVPA